MMMRGPFSQTSSSAPRLLPTRPGLWRVSSGQQTGEGTATHRLVRMTSSFSGTWSKYVQTIPRENSRSSSSSSISWSWLNVSMSMTGT